VEAGQTLMILEAMKMEHRVVASEDGIVTKVSFSAGDRVEQGLSLLEVETNQ
jgi:biotin carboxyl carrier protein